MKNFIVPVLFISFFIFAEVFAYRAIRRIFHAYGPKRVAIFYWGFTFLEIAFVVWARTWDNYPRNIAVNLLMILFAMKFFMGLFILGNDIVLLVKKLFSKELNIEQPALDSRRAFIGKMALGLAGIPFLTMNYGIFKTAFSFKIHREKLKFPNFPAAFNGLKMIQISDIHTGSLVNAHQLDKAIDLILEEKPDIIVFTGDLVNNRTDEAYPYIENFKRLKAPMGVFSVLGNHDYGDYETWVSAEEKQLNFNEMMQLHKDMGFTLLMNEAKHFEKDGETWSLLGVENWGANLHFPKYGKLNKALEQAPLSPFKILLSHDPSHWEAEVTDKTNIDLALAGHTHGFQLGVEIPGFIKWSPSQYAYKQWAGLYQHGKQLLYVNRGLGCIGYMGRIGIRPEITVFEFEQS